MSDIKLFRYGQKDAVELAGKAALIEKQLQTLIEAQMETFQLNTALERHTKAALTRWG
jgi:hypothetical protein